MKRKFDGEARTIAIKLSKEEFHKLDNYSNNAGFYSIGATVRFIMNSYFEKIKKEDKE
jgi:hypothetical protein